MQALTTSPLVRTYTLEEFWELPELKGGSKLELIRGERVESKVLAKFSTSVSEICRAVPRKLK